MAQPTDWKRTLSLALGAAGVVHGLRRGGITGLLEVAASVWALKQSLPGLQLDGQASPARSARDIPAERLPDAGCRPRRTGRRLQRAPRTHHRGCGGHGAGTGRRAASGVATRAGTNGPVDSLSGAAPSQ